MPRGFVNLLDHAFGDGSNDDANAVAQAVSFAQSGGKWLWVPRTADSYDIGSTVTIEPGIGVRCYGAIRANSSFAKSQPAVIVGASGQANPRQEIEISVDNASLGSSIDWSSMSYVGVRLYNPQDCEIIVRAIRGFTIGLEIIGDGDGGAFSNTIWLYDLEDCRYAVQLDARNGAPCKNNTLLNGAWRISSGASTAGADLERGLMRIVSGDASAAALAKGNEWQSPGPIDVSRGSSQSSRKLFYLHTQGPMNGLKSVSDGAALDGTNDAELVAEGAQAFANIVELGDWEGTRTRRIEKFNGAPSNQNAVHSRKDWVDNIHKIEGSRA